MVCISRGQWPDANGLPAFFQYRKILPGNGDDRACLIGRWTQGYLLQHKQFFSL